MADDASLAASRSASAYPRYACRVPTYGVVVSLGMRRNSETACRVEKGSEASRLPWVKLRRSLWPHVSEQDHANDIAKILSEPTRNAAFLGYSQAAECVAFAEAAIRHDYVNGCHSTPVGFLEGIYVAPTHRRKGIARTLCAAVEHWVVSRGCSELASDAALVNLTGQEMHSALGFTETQRVVFFRKSLKVSC